MASDSDIFSVPASLTDRYRVEDEKLGPVSSMSEEGPALGELAFFVPASSHGLISLPELSFEFELSIKKKRANETAWTAINETDKVAPVNFIAHSVFQSCQVSLCNRTISDTGKQNQSTER